MVTLKLQKIPPTPNPLVKENTFLNVTCKINQHGLKMCSYYQKAVRTRFTDSHVSLTSGILILWVLNNMDAILQKEILIALWWMKIVTFWFKFSIKFVLIDPIGKKSSLVHVMAWCHQAPSHYLNLCWPGSVTSYTTTRPQWVNEALYTCVNEHVTVLLFCIQCHCPMIPRHCCMFCLSSYMMSIVWSSLVWLIDITQYTILH